MGTVTDINVARFKEPERLELLTEVRIRASFWALPQVWFWLFYYNLCDRCIGKKGTIIALRRDPDCSEFRYTVQFDFGDERIIKDYSAENFVVLGQPKKGR